MDGTGVPALQREGDTHTIMDSLVLQSNRFMATEICRINLCHLSLKAYTLSDLTTSDGATLDLSKMAGTPSLVSSYTKGHHINQACPSDIEWALWRRANLLWSTTDGVLHQPMGYRIVEIYNQQPQHQVYSTRECLWLKTATTYT